MGLCNSNDSSACRTITTHWRTSVSWETRGAEESLHKIRQPVSVKFNSWKMLRLKFYSPVLGQEWILCKMTHFFFLQFFLCCLKTWENKKSPIEDLKGTSAVCLCKLNWELYCRFKTFITQKLLPASWFVSVFFFLMAILVICNLHNF